MKNIKKKLAKCDVCKHTIEIDKYGNGECSECGWRQSEESFEHPNVAGIRNIPSLYNAISQYKIGDSATLANFDDFISAYKRYGELEFTLNNIRYGVLFDDANNKIALLEILNNKKQLFNDIDDLAKNAKINGILLKNIWQNVTDTDFLQNT